MADWYVSSAVYVGLTKWAASTAYTVGQLIKPLTTPAFGLEHVFRCTTAGTSSGTEPSWPTTNNSTVTNGTAVFTNVTGQSAYGWSAAAGTLWLITGSRVVVGDRVFLSSDHVEGAAGSTTVSYGLGGLTNTVGTIQYISVNRAGSVPPVAADELSGAQINFVMSGSPNFNFDSNCNVYIQGVSIIAGGTVGSTGGTLVLNNNSRKQWYLKNCALAVTNGAANGGHLTLNFGKFILDNTTLRFSHIAQCIDTSGAPLEFVWANTPSAFAGSVFPTNLFNTGSNSFLVTCRGVDLSAFTGTLLTTPSTNNANNRVLLDSCRISPSMTKMSSTTTGPVADVVELVNCYDGTNVLNERYTTSGTVVTNRSIYLNGGAQDDIGNYSLKLASNANSDFTTVPLDCFPLDTENTVIGASKTATVEICSSVALNTNDIRLLLEYMSTSGSSIASFGDSLASVLTAASALPSSSNTWNGFGSSPTAHRYWQIYMTTAAGNAYSFAEIQFRTTAGTSLAFSGGTASAYNSFSGQPPANATDGNNATVWGSTDTTPGAWTYDYGVGNALNIVEIMMTSRNDSFYTQTPTLFTPQWSDNGTTWTSMQPIAATWTGSTQTQTFAVLPSLPTSKQLLQVTFTPQRAGRVRGLVRLGKIGTTVWVNPQIAIA